ncbi:MAG TPA: hypothetical protein PKA41_18130 [Verrucomicrobiota bacterium]|nr:hypothetical protein [Verrucomicrobiota bacterium]
MKRCLLRICVSAFLAALTLGGTGCPALILGGLAASSASMQTSQRQQKNGGAERSQLEIRQMQQQTFETTDTRQVFMAVMNTLQDDGFIVRQAQLDVGLLNASKSIDVADMGQVFSATLMSSLTGARASYANNAVVEVSVNVGPFKAATRIRANFENKVFDNAGAVWSSEVVAEEDFYQDFFSKVSKAVFIEQEQL